MLIAKQDVVMKSPSKEDKEGETPTKKSTGKPKKEKVVDAEIVAKEKEKQDKRNAKEEKERKVAEVRYVRSTHSKVY
jgi:hypothetical protein